jgi:hypothetical protein
MLRLTTGRPVTHCDGVPRRELLRAGAIGFGGLTLPGLLRLQAAGVNPTRRIDSVILLYLSGGPSQLDMWDMKPHAPEEIRGTFQEVPTKVPGIRISEHMPRMATLADQYTIVRSMSHNEGDHIRGGYWVMTGGRLTRPIVQASGMKREDRPHIGSALDYLMGASGSLPSFAVVPEFTSPVGVPRPGQYAGFLGPGYDPYLIDSDPNLAGYDPGPLRATESLRGIRLSGRQSLLQQIDRHGHGTVTDAMFLASRHWSLGALSKRGSGWFRLTLCDTTMGKAAKGMTAIRCRRAHLIWNGQKKNCCHRRMRPSRHWLRTLPNAIC